MGASPCGDQDGAIVDRLRAPHRWRAHDAARPRSRLVLASRSWLQLLPHGVDTHMRLMMLVVLVLVVGSAGSAAEDIVDWQVTLRRLR